LTSPKHKPLPLQTSPPKLMAQTNNKTIANFLSIPTLSVNLLDSK